jgi:hypothetical protein
MSSGGLNENLTTRRNFWNVPNQIVTSFSEFMEANFCVTNLGTLCIFHRKNERRIESVQKEVIVAGFESLS